MAKTTKKAPTTKRAKAAPKKAPAKGKTAEATKAAKKGPTPKKSAALPTSAAPERLTALAKDLREALKPTPQEAKGIATVLKTLAGGEPPTAKALAALRDGVNAAAKRLRAADDRQGARRLSTLNRQVRRLERWRRKRLDRFGWKPGDVTVTPPSPEEA